MAFSIVVAKKSNFDRNIDINLRVMAKNVFSNSELKKSIFSRNVGNPRDMVKKPIISWLLQKISLCPKS